MARSTDADSRFEWNATGAFRYACAMRIVVDTNVFVAACLGSKPAKLVVERCLLGTYVPLMGTTLFLEYEDVLGRKALFRTGRLDPQERTDLLDIFLACCEWVRISFRWRPNLRDESDNHLIELAVAGDARWLVTRNVRDFADPEVRFPGLSIIPPDALWEN
jgi:putative PIN family toxin of toxin-antitoxin system